MKEINPSVLAEWMHNNYEEISQKLKWKTQKKCRVKFKDLPKENKKVMIELARRLLKKRGLKLVVYVCPICNYEHETKKAAVDCCSGEN